jgi:hypothetical protein
MLQWPIMELGLAAAANRQCIPGQLHFGQHSLLARDRGIIVANVISLLWRNSFCAMLYVLNVRNGNPKYGK